MDHSNEVGFSAINEGRNNNDENILPVVKDIIRVSGPLLAADVKVLAAGNQCIDGRAVYSAIYKLVGSGQAVMDSQDHLTIADWANKE